MQRRDNIKPELNADYKHLCSPTVPFTDFLFGADPDLSKQLKDLAEATKVSKKISKNSDSRRELYRGQTYNKSYKNTKGKKFGYKYPNQSLNSKRPNFFISQKGGGEEAQIGPQDPSTATGKVKNTVIAGRLKEFGPQWHKITSDTEVLDWVQNCHTEFIDDIEPVQLGGHKVSKFNQSELSVIDREIEKLLSTGVIERCSHSAGEFISPIFLRLKKNKVDYHMILNLKDLNNLIHSVLDLMTPGCFVASIDIKDAYYSVPIAKEHQKCLKFIWRDNLYQYVCLPKWV
ncbi:uncharacterized protein [Montipora capricornis]|uniref:uncharacterized protein n=1 Tax=Montipora capricornis TaxID=246305 RepID=UPI0035F1ADEE